MNDHGGFWDFRVVVHASRRDRRPRHFYRVWLFPDRPTMYAFDRERRRMGIHTGRNRSDFLAQASWWGAKARGHRIPNCVGEVIFDISWVGSGLVSHEMTHAALYYLQGSLGVKHVDWRDKKIEERLAYIQGNLVQGFWRQWHRHKFDRRRRAPR